MNFDDLKRAWDDCDHELDSRLRLNAQRLRSVLTQNAGANANKRLHGDIDYTVPLVLVHQFDTNVGRQDRSKFCCLDRGDLSSR